MADQRAGALLFQQVRIVPGRLSVGRMEMGQAPTRAPIERRLVFRTVEVLPRGVGGHWGADIRGHEYTEWEASNE